MTKIETISASILDIPTIRGHVLSMTTMRVQSTVLVEIGFSDGSIGLGEGATIGGLSYGAESPESVKSAIDSYIAPVLRGLDGDRVNEACDLVRRMVYGNPIARCAVETALWDGLARRMGVSLAALFGGRSVERLPVVWALASGNTETDIAEAQEMIASGRHTAFKLKIGKRSVREDITHVAAIRDALGPDISLRVDVNQGWSLAEARDGIAGLRAVDVGLIEQPVAAQDIEGLAALCGAVPIMADETLHGPHDAFAVARGRAADVFAVKIAQSGGLAPARDVIAIARAAGIGIYGGTMLEAGVGTAAALQLFASVGHIDWGTEFFGPLLLTDEILTEPLVYANAHVRVPTGPGLGVTIDTDKVDFYRRDRERTAHRVAG